MPGPYFEPKVDPGAADNWPYWRYVLGVFILVAVLGARVLIAYA
jgi:hypothetical protein